MGLQRFPVSSFRGGWNVRDAPFGLEPDEALNAQNVRLSLRGQLSKRGGLTKKNIITSNQGDWVTGQRPWYPDPSRSFLFLSSKGSIYYIKEGDTTFTPLVFIPSPGPNATWCFEPMVNKFGIQSMWAQDGQGNKKAWDTAFSPVTPVNMPDGSILKSWRNRMMIAGNTLHPQRLYYSGIGDPGSNVNVDDIGIITPDPDYGNNWVDIRSSDDDLDPIVWLETLGDYLIIFKRNSTWVMNDPSTFTSRRLGSPGCEGRFQSAVINNRVFFFSRTGVWSTDGVRAPVLESGVLDPWFAENVEPQSYITLNSARVVSTPDGKLLVAITFNHVTYENDHTDDPGGAAAADTSYGVMLEFLPSANAQDITDQSSPQQNSQHGGWSFHTLWLSSFGYWRGSINKDDSTSQELVGFKGWQLGPLASSHPHLYKVFDGLDDDGDSFEAIWQSGWRPFISEEAIERIRRANATFSGYMDINFYSDFSSTPNFSGTYDSGGGIGFVRLRPESRGRYHSWQIRNDHYDSTFELTKLEMAIRGGKEH